MVEPEAVGELVTVVVALSGAVMVKDTIALLKVVMVHHTVETLEVLEEAGVTVEAKAEALHQCRD